MNMANSGDQPTYTECDRSEFSFTTFTVSGVSEI